jgi:putative ABC transport system permease protein
MPSTRTIRVLSLAVALSLTATVAHAQSASPRSIARGAASPRSIAIDERLAADAGLHVGSRVVLSAQPGESASGDTVVIGAITRQGADPSEVARSEYRVRLHLDQLQALTGYGNRVDRFAVGAPGERAADSAVAAINRSAFGFHAYRSRDVAVETSRTFQVVSRFHRAIGVITIAASGIFLLCILLLKVEERRRDVAALRLMGVSRGSVVRSVVLEAALVSVLGSALGVVVGWVTTLLINWHYRAVYRTPLAFALVTPDIVLFAVGLSLVLGVGAGYLAARRLVRTPPLALFGR